MGKKWLALLLVAGFGLMSPCMGKAADGTSTDGIVISLVQVKGDPDPQVNLDTARRYAREAAKAGADLAVFPEMFMALPGKNESLAGVAETLDGPFVRELAAIARKESIFLCAGIWERSPQASHVYNTAVVIDPSGKIAAVYRKLHLFDALSVKESALMLAGDAPPPVFSIRGLTVGLAICYDLRFPELFRYLASKGADVIVVPAAWYAGPMKEDMWLTLLRARAMENVCYTAGADLTAAPFAGRSAAFDPFGTPLVNTGEAEGLVTFTAKRARIDEVRGKLPSLEHRRFDIFSEGMKATAEP